MRLTNWTRWAALIALAASVVPFGESLAQPDSLWSVTCGGNGNDSLWSLIATRDGGFLAVGSKAIDQNEDGYIVRIDGRGGKVWQTSIGSLEMREVCRGAVELDEGGFVLCGLLDTRENNVCRGLMIAVSGQGDSTGYFQFGEAGGYDDGYSIVQISDSLLAIGGVSKPGENRQKDMAIQVVNKNGTHGELIRYGEQEPGEYGLDLIRCHDLGFALAGQRFVFKENGDIDSATMVVTRTTPYLQMEWMKSYTVNTYMTLGNSIIQTADNGYLVCGSIGEYDEDWGIIGWDVWLIKLDSRGERMWAQAYDLGREEMGMQVIPVNDGYVVVGVIGGHDGGYELTNTDCFLLRVNEEGNREWSKEFGGRDDDRGLKVIRARDNGYLIGGTTASRGAGGTDMWIMKTAPDPLGITEKEVSIPDEFTLSSFPNPFNSSTVIEYSVNSAGNVRLGAYDLCGKLVNEISKGYIQPGNYRIVWNARTLPAGAYVLKLEGENGGFVGKRVYLIR